MTALRKVLVVDDDPVVTTSFDRVLSREGYVVVTARNGTEALDKLNSGDYDVVYTDIRMPGMDGLELAERVKARRSWTPVVIITGYGSEASERRAKAAGVNAFLHKPLSPEIIEASARQAVDFAPPVVAPTVAPTAPMAAPVTAPAAAPRPAEPEAAPSAWKAIGLVLAGPLLGLAFVVLLPFVGLALLAGMALYRFFAAPRVRAVAGFVKNVALFVAAPFIGLAYVVLLPFVGLGALAWVAVSGMAKKQRSG
jgi:CheY-like chemotaxis protein